ncbi:cobyrinate a,c-diamide synthase [Oceanobacillus senegalensis]|uniref:cobyrinate a,c-diamide synthase n=1 Tax=Oceanobacillus senegalensis TaxID=1936063 RepID=UPI0015C4792C|nr:cobyrinate a,c-diamide synthase [Oceanobacillus senegalensis]
MTDRRLVIAGTGSGVGKTTLTLGIMSALKKRGLNVQGFKCGPDYIDPTYHTAVTGRVSRNLDSWMLSDDSLLDVFKHGSMGADVSIIEGVMGYFDGKRPETDEGSTAEISMLTKSPVLLVVNCSAMARSAAAIVKGFQSLSDGANIVGVIANKVGSEGHFQLVKIAIEKECGIPVIGYLKREQDVEIPERHLGLVPSIERGELDSLFDRLGDFVLETIDMDKLLELSVAEPLEGINGPSLFDKRKETTVKIAVAKDAAFHFYYPENIELLETNGVEISYFSPLENEVIPDDVDGIYLGGGFPEEFAQKLAVNHITKESLKRAIENGLPTIAECGGFMYLTESIETTDNLKHEMIGIIPLEIKMESQLVALGYREISGEDGNFFLKGLVARGHVFHYSTFQTNKENIPYAYETKGIRGKQKEGYLIHNVVAGYTHIHFASCPTMVGNWIEKCIEVKKAGNDF